MTYSQAIEYIGSFSKSGEPMRDLVRFVILMRLLDNPHNKIRTIHVAGTNGKGSVCEYISGALKAAGLTVGKFTSPYIKCIEERIQVGGRCISEPAFALLCDQVRNAVITSGFEGYSQFEILTAIAFLYFEKEKVDYAVIETGIGGSYDCTNVITPVISVITTIDYDHTDLLGETISEIARHKAGIIKPSVPCVCSPGQHEDALRVISKRCHEFNSELIVPELSRIQILHMDITDCFFSYMGMNYHTTMSGEHQIYNAVCAVEVLKKLEIPYSNIFTGIEKSSLPARMEITSVGNVRCIIDGSHNPSAVRSAVKLLDIEKKPVYAVVGMLTTKDWQTVLDIMVKRFDGIIFVDGFAPNCVPAAILTRYAIDKGGRCTVETDIEKALNIACEKAGKTEGYAMITGSLYLASEARKIIMSKKGNIS